MTNISERYRETLITMHQNYKKWGTDGRKHLDEIVDHVLLEQPKNVIDYGCGKGELRAAIDWTNIGVRNFHEYDPGIPGKDVLKCTSGFDLVTCTDVMEHVEREHIAGTLSTIATLLKDGGWAFFVINTRQAKAVLPDGRNAHLTIKDADWWRSALSRAGLVPYKSSSNDKELTAWCKKMPVEANAANGV